MIPQETIDQLRAIVREKRSVVPIAEHNKETLQKKRSLQLEWLATFSKLLSPAMTCKRLEIPYATYSNWKKDPEFLELYNETLVAAKEELQGAVLVRAMGNQQSDELGNPLFDPNGRPVYSGGSDRLAIALLGLEQKSTAPISVSIEIVSRRDKD